MTAESRTAGDPSLLTIKNPPPHTMTAPIVTAIVSWVAISVGFFGLKMLMEERPEFVGQPQRVAKAELVQEAPQVVTRKSSDDVSVIRPSQPEHSEVRFEMNGRRDYRGLRTIRDMSGTFHASYVLTNSSDEMTFVLFKCPHPRTENGDNQGLLASELRLQASTAGLQESTTNAWIWSGALDARSSATIEVSYAVASLKAVSYRALPRAANQIKHLRVAFHRRDLGSLRFESGDGTKRSQDENVVWERKDFLAPDFFTAEIEEGRNLYSSITQLLEIGPLICLLFLLSTSATILARQKMTSVQMLTIAAGYAFYFPLILYLSAKFSFVWALILALVIPGILLVNYARWLLGPQLGLIGGSLFLVLFQIFPTVAAFAGWHRGMVLLCLGVVTLAVLTNLQNRALRSRVAIVAMTFLIALPFGISAAEVQVILPAELASRIPDAKHDSTGATNSLVAFEPAQYEARQQTNYFQVEARVPLQIIRIGEIPSPIFSVPIYLQESSFEAAEPNLGRIVLISNRLNLVCQQSGRGAIRLVYRVPVESIEGKKRAQIPLVVGPSGNLRLESDRSDLEIINGSLWSRNSAENRTAYDVGVAGEETILLEWREGGRASAPGAGQDSKTSSGAAMEESKAIYGIGLTRAQNLTIVNSDGSCTHFAELELPVAQSEDFQMKLPAKGRLVSVSVNGSEIGSPSVEYGMCRIHLPKREPQQTVHRLSFRIAYPSMRLGFAGLAEMSLPELFQTVGTLEWIIALPNNFDSQVVACALETQKSSPDLSRFGDYGRVLKTHPQLYLAKDLAPPGVITLNMRYRQLVPGIYEARAE